MAGHSKFKNIVHRKTAQDSKKSSIFTKLGKEIISAVKLTSTQDIYSDNRVQSAIKNAKNNNMPKENIASAIDRALMAKNRSREDLITYECKGPNGVLMIIEADTDNRAKTGSEIRSVLNKHGFCILGPNSVVHIFEQIGSIEYTDIKLEELSDKILVLMDKHKDLFMKQIVSGIDSIVIQTDQGHFCRAVQILTQEIGHPLSSEISWNPIEFVALMKESIKKLNHILDALHQIEGIVSIYHNVRGEL